MDFFRDSEKSNELTPNNRLKFLNQFYSLSQIFLKVF